MATAEAQSEPTAQQDTQVPPGFVELAAPRPFEVWRVQIIHIAGYACEHPDTTIVMLVGGERRIKVDLPVEEVDRRIREALGEGAPKAGAPLVW